MTALCRPANNSAAAASADAWPFASSTSEIGVKVMRAVLVGLVGAVLAVGSAAAGSCPIDRGVFQALDTGWHYLGLPVERPDLAGAKFKVTRYTDVKKWVSHNGGKRDVGYEAVRLEGKAGSFVIKKERVIGSPSFMATAWSAQDEAQKVAWRASKAPVVAIGNDRYVTELGVFNGLVVRLVGCQPRH